MALLNSSIIATLLLAGAEPSPHAASAGRAVTEAVAPVYPPLAVSARLEGSIEASATVDTRGHVVAFEVATGHILLKTAIQKVLPQWQFSASAQDTTETLHFIFDLIPWDGQRRDPMTVFRPPATIVLREQVHVMADPPVEGVASKPKGTKSP